MQNVNIIDEKSSGFVLDDPRGAASVRQREDFWVVLTAIGLKLLGLVLYLQSLSH